MVIKGSRTTAARARKFLIQHLLRGAENDAVHILAGGEDRLEEYIRHAQERGVTYAIRHFIIAPALPMTDQEAFWVIVELAQAFGFDASRATVVRHSKARHGVEGDLPHWHACVAETDPAERGGRVLSSSHSYVTHEMVGRAAERRFGHPCVPGPHHPKLIREAE